MDMQAVLNVSFGIAGALGGFVLKVVWDAISMLREDLKALEVKVPQDYVSKIDLKQYLDDLIRRLDRIEKKIDNSRS